MSQQVQIVCDYCGEVKKESNHWFKIFLNSDQDCLVIYKYDPKISPDDKKVTKDACGSQCVQKAVEEFTGC